MYSIYHFFRALLLQKEQFAETAKLKDFPFGSDLFSCSNTREFPNLAIKLNQSNALFTGGEFIELKDSNTYTISPFNSTIPTAKKDIAKIIRKDNCIVKQQMQQAGDNIFSLKERDVYYLIRGRNKQKTAQKIALIHGSFFETIQNKDLMKQSFSQVLDEHLMENDWAITPEIKDVLTTIFSEQEDFNKIQSVEKASLKLHFDFQTVIKAKANILNTAKYPKILDNTLNFVLPYHSEEDRELAHKKMNIIFTKSELQTIQEIKLKHHFNGDFIVFQAHL